MELNICLYCEKRLLDDATSFCSSTCRSNEANKAPTVSTVTAMEPLLFTTSISHRRRGRVMSAVRSDNSPLTSYHDGTPLSRVSSASSTFSDDAASVYFSCD